MDLKFNTNITGMVEKLELSRQVVLDQAHVFVNQLTELGAEAARQKLKDEVTRHGNYRMSKNPSQGNSAGRDDTGTMIAGLTAIGSEVDDDDNVYASVGWENPEDYFYAQELGGGGGYGPIPAANSLFAAEEVMMNNIGRLEKNMKERIRYRTKG